VCIFAWGGVFFAWGEFGTAMCSILKSLRVAMPNSPGDRF
jgi:hypothetical protein